MQQYLVAQAIDHTLLKPDADMNQIIRVCKEAIDNKFFGVCVNSCWIPIVATELKNSSVAAVSVIGFPLGAMATQSKSFEAEWSNKNGAAEIDMVINLGWLKDKNFSAVRNDISEVVKACGDSKLKVIIETHLLNEDEKRWACALSAEAGAHFVKTCTGFNGGAATVSDIQLMRSVVGSDLGVKASGGIKNYEQAVALMEAGANRLGTSSGVAIISGKNSTGGY